MCLLGSNICANKGRVRNSIQGSELIVWQGWVDNDSGLKMHNACFFSQNKYSPFVFIERECIEFIYSPAIWGVICPHRQIAPLGPPIWGGEGDSEEKLFWRGPLRKYVPNACS